MLPEPTSQSSNNLTSSRRALLAYIVLLILGLACLLHWIGTGQATGVAGVVIGAGGLFWECMRIRRRLQAARAAREQTERHRKQQELRHARRKKERTDRQHTREVALHATEQRAVRQRRERDAKRQRTAEETARRVERQEIIAREAARLKHLPDAELRLEVRAIFQQRGFDVIPLATEAEWRLLPAGAALPETALWLPATAVASVDDLQVLEALRREECAQHGYLIAPGGFSPACVRLVERLPITLLEMQSLAAWKIHAQPSSEPLGSADRVRLH